MARSTTRRTSPQGRGRPINSYGDDRICETAACTTMLSRYNSTSRCALHQWSDSGIGRTD